MGRRPTTGYANEEIPDSMPLQNQGAIRRIAYDITLNELTPPRGTIAEIDVRSGPHR